MKLLVSMMKYFSFKRVVNFILLSVSYLLSRFKVLNGVPSVCIPYFISIEPANFCNLRCPECPVGNRKQAATKKLLMQMELYKKLIDELKSRLMHVIFYFQGEPLLNSNLADMIVYAHERKIYTSLSTNAQLLSSEVARDLVKSGLDKLIVSVDGATQDVYEQYRVGGDLNKVLDGINHLVYWKRELKKVTPYIEMQCLVLKSNEHELGTLKQLANDYGVDRIVFKSAQFYDFEQGNELMPTLSKYSRYKAGKNGRYFLKNKLRNHCWRLWSGAVVNSNGDILPCCFDKDGNYSFGNVRDELFTACWHGKKASGFRKQILKNRKQFEMCRNCTS